MPSARRAACSALVALVAVTGCTGVEGEPGPAPRTFTENFGSADLDSVAPAGVDVLDLAAVPDGGSLALVADTADPRVGYLVPISQEGLGDVRRVEDVGTQLFVTPDGTALVTGPGRLTRVPPGGALPTVVEVGVVGDAAALSPDGRRLYLATDDGRLAAVDAATGEVTATTALAEGLTVQSLAVRPDGGPTALLSDARAPDLADVAALATWDDDLQQTAGPIELAPDQPASIPSALQVTDDGTAVATLTAGSGDDPFRVVTVAGEEVTTFPIPGTDRTPADLAVSPDGRVAYLPVVGFEVESGVVTLDLSDGDQLAAAQLCPGQGAFGQVALAADGATLTVVGSCTTAQAPTSLAFIAG
ncbi:hypothetical protein SAMN05660690_2552 [Geodermatophilus telluris]|uniref:DNA-binding beta-propeller fold protein YncE n=1 Tax=Geodermatophilus telluris TaxID=1190417 RepID=A0A1G6PEW4_9ACTN|nr:hypothetical protein [Geodermatophilus telluris]SDC78770.1 hypothetical protein SAMN05660690_2552 [Geodermatophilus telluris]